jgi:hypothetical protein
MKTLVLNSTNKTKFMMISLSIKTGRNQYKTNVTKKNNENPTISTFLSSIGLAHLLPNFEHEGVEFEHLYSLSENDFRQMQISIKTFYILVIIAFFLRYLTLSIKWSINELKS